MTVLDNAIAALRARVDKLETDVAELRRTARQPKPEQPKADSVEQPKAPRTA
jgi:hypothetical protein